MKTLHVLFLLLLAAMLPQGRALAQCCATDTLVINTGYNPIHPSGTTGQITPVGPPTSPITSRDPKWVIDSISPLMLADIISTGRTRAHLRAA